MFIVLLFSLACKRDFSPFLKTDLPDKTSHEFTWATDTIIADAYQIELYDLWGTDENNIWAVGHSDLIRYRIWHYDGSAWENVYVQSVGHVPTYSEIFGFSENDFWIVGYGVKSDDSPAVGYILHYDGSWNRMDNLDMPIIESVWGSSSKDMYFGCFKGEIIHYNGEKFTTFKTEDDIQYRSLWGVSDSSIFALGNKIVELGPNQFNSISVLYKLNHGRFELQDSADNYNKGFGMDLWGYDIDTFYSAADGIYKYVIGQWVNQFKSSTIYSVFGSSYNNVFAGGFNTGLYHYNGNTWKKIENAPFSSNIWSIWANDKYVYLLQDYGNYRIVSKGLHKKQ